MLEYRLRTTSARLSVTVRVLILLVELSRKEILAAVDPIRATGTEVCLIRKRQLAGEPGRSAQVISTAMTLLGGHPQPLNT